MTASLQALSFLALTLSCLGPSGTSAAGVPRKQPTAPGRLAIFPSEIVLDRPGTTQQVVVQEISPSGAGTDVTGRVRYAVADPRIAAATPGGVVLPRRRGTTLLRISRPANGPALSAPIRVLSAGEPYRWDFRTHIAPLLVRQGCSGTSCHGSAAGKGGFRLSAFGHNPEADYLALVREGGGRRVDRRRPGASLVLRKPSLGLPHGGGLRLPPGSPAYRQVAEWIASGAPYGAGQEVRSLSLQPRRLLLDGRGERHRLLLTALYTDGTREDVTFRAAWESRDERAFTAADGVVRAGQPGEAPLLARFGGQIAVAEVGVAAAGTGRAAGEALIHPIDREVDGRLRRLGLPAAPPAPAEEICRRLYLDLIGRIPTPEELAAFQAQPAAGRVLRLVDDLLASPEHHRAWRNLLHARLMGRTAFPPDPSWAAWLERAVAEDRPWDAVVRPLIVARPAAAEDEPAVHFLERRFSIGDTGLDLATRDVSRLFFGVDIQCARCHVHPDVTSWHQEAYWGLASFFARSYRLQIKERFYLAERATGEAEYFGPDREKRTARAVTLAGACPEESPAAETAEAYLVPPEEAKEKTRVPVPKQSRREALARLAIRGDDPYFRRAVVNWVWQQLMGRGLVEPIDQMHPGNPASHPALLDDLADRFAAGGMRLRGLIRLIVTSRAYARTSAWTGPNRPAPELYAVAHPRALDLAQLSESVLVAAGYWKSSSEAPGPRRSRFQAENAGTIQELRLRLDTGTEHFSPGASQALYLANAPRFAEIVAGGGLAERLCADPDDAAVVRAAYLHVLSRPPEAEELRAFERHMKARSGRRVDAARQILWALLASTEFRFNH